MTTLAADKSERIHGLTQTNNSHIKRSYDMPAMLILSEEGKIFYANKEAGELLDLSPKQLSKLHISKVILELINMDLLEEGKKRVNAYLRFLSRIGYKFELCNLHGKRFSGVLFFNDIDLHGRHSVVVLIYPDSKVYSNVIYQFNEGE